MTPSTTLAEQPKAPTWHSQAGEEVLTQLGSSANGLSAQEAALRLAANGPNELKEGKRISPLQIFLSQFKSLIIWILIAAGVISGLLGERVDAIAILTIVVLNAVIGFYQEFNAEKSIAALKKMTAPEAKVRRDGKVASVPASEIVRGDILTLEAGDLVAADARLLTAASLKCIESALTGESEAETKLPETLESDEVPLGDRKNMVFMGTSVAAGTGQAIVVATAMNTELGRIAGLIAEAGAEERTPLEKKLESFGRVLVWAALGIVALLFGLGLLRGTEPFELFMTSVSLAVAAVPEGLPAAVTVSLALGVLRMSRRHALVRKLPVMPYYVPYRHYQPFRCARVWLMTMILSIGICTMSHAKNIEPHLENSVCGFLREPLAFWQFRRAAGTADASRVRSIRDIERLSFTTRDGRELGGYKLRADDPQGYLLVAQGNAMLADQIMGVLAFFRDSGLDVYVYDYRGYGLSEGKSRLKAIVSDYREIVAALNAQGYRRRYL